MEGDDYTSNDYTSNDYTSNDYTSNDGPSDYGQQFYAVGDDTSAATTEADPPLTASASSGRFTDKELDNLETLSEGLVIGGVMAEAIPVVGTILGTASIVTGLAGEVVVRKTRQNQAAHPAGSAALDVGDFDSGMDDDVAEFSDEG